MTKDKEWLDEKRQRCIESYSSKTKMKTVSEWKVRIVSCGLTQTGIAKQIGCTVVMLSQYMSLLHEPSDERYRQIEDIIRQAEKNK